MPILASRSGRLGLRDASRTSYARRSYGPDPAKFGPRTSSSADGPWEAPTPLRRRGRSARCPSSPRSARSRGSMCAYARLRGHGLAGNASIHRIQGRPRTDLCAIPTKHTSDPGRHFGRYRYDLKRRHSLRWEPGCYYFASHRIPCCAKAKARPLIVSGSAAGPCEPLGLATSDSKCSKVHRDTVVAE